MQLKRKPCKAAQEKRRSVIEFYQRDDVSRLTTGKKETKSMKGIKQQKRFLLDTLKNSHMKYLMEHPGQLSYSLFCSYRTFWVMIPTVQDRNTCLCKIHENTRLEAEKLKQLRIVSHVNVREHVSSIVCDPNSVACMYGKCDECKDARVKCENYDKNEEVWWWTWKTKSEEREFPNKKCTSTVKITSKVKVSGCAFDLVSSFEESLAKMKKHQFNITHQYEACKTIREEMSEDEAMLHIDFSENYVTKYADEPQSAHFGASHSQITLHTGILYLRGKDPVPFCTVSPSTQHSPVAIWAYLEPVFGLIKELQPQVKTIHFFSDGPVTQYRQKQNFYLFSKIIFTKGFQLGTWNYFEAGHGKGAPDGIGASLKRTADNLIAHKRDIPDAFTFVELIKPNTTVKVYLVKEEDFEDYPDLHSLPTVPGNLYV